MCQPYLVYSTAGNTRVNAIKMKEKNERPLDRFVFDCLSSDEWAGSISPRNSPRDGSIESRRQGRTSDGHIDTNARASEASPSHSTRLVGLKRTEQTLTSDADLWYFHNTVTSVWHMTGGLLYKWLIIILVNRQKVVTLYFQKFHSLA